MGGARGRRSFSFNIIDGFTIDGVNTAANQVGVGRSTFAAALEDCLTSDTVEVV